MNRSKLQQQIEATQQQLVRLQEQLNNCFPTLEEAVNGDELEGGWIVIEKYNGGALLAAPQDTVKELSWNDRNKVLKGLPGDCFIPSVEQLQLAYTSTTNVRYWSSVEGSYNIACYVSFTNGSKYFGSKKNMHCVRAFRFVVF